MQASNRFKGIRIWIWAVALGCSSPLFAKSSHDKIIYRIGFIHPRSGPLAPFGNSLAQGVKLGLQQFRLENPKLGEQIGLISADDRGLASEGEKAAKRLIQQQKVQLLIGSVSNSVNLSLAAVSNQSETPLLLPRGTDEDMLGKPHIFTMSLAAKENQQRRGQCACLSRLIPDHSPTLERYSQSRHQIDDYW
ncbi:MAG: ABC transporter substrate-binding protein [Proteobacteria bacterium]|nr:ABC transporter substrate-binding protein [Pseudomonadota bacterium]